ncbi:hypothetical protein ERO13_A02G023500v2 [Gossypium hirsutum]|uniref:Leucine-rich repeat extensin-like protein 5 n=4 Tax=Gossypium TaxID=3633 RepID=A0A1U8PRI0_GOSHI|nr:leucine-rich repeat extensin-like protein 5 [Gossypium hirsutum]KAB2092408.1 hypothetical protein ES319_A02G029000v1 [Gossypium barbadense]KAG4210102.1 hypothetical protein ERO13_A02G023500v2 [Gossypium hirsutum]TYH26953.1 hypothetical protein ES288_A02G030500v1 [Gossypium darwinii]TYJ45064.1 hypothetical protein E1A91_A02G030200v1 [Gossypium mustelinum]
MGSKICMLLLYSTMAATLLTHCDARTSMGMMKDPKHGKSSVIKHTNKLQLMSKLMSLVMEQPTDNSNTQPYGVSSPFSLPPFDSLPPLNSPPYFPPPPSTSGTVPSPPQFSSTPNPPGVLPSPPQTIPTPTSPSGPILSPPSPIGSNPSPTVFFPPIVYPPPTVPPPPNMAPTTALWCVAKPSVPDPIIQEAMNYACAAGADCDSIQPSGSCFQPDSLFAHASYAFNSYWQKSKLDGGTCEFGGTAILVAIDPSYNGCHFEYQY